MSVAKRHQISLTVLLSFALFLSLANRIYSAEDLYLKARNLYSSLECSDSKSRQRWETCIDLLKSVYGNDVSDSRADDALFMTGNIYARLYQSSHKKTDLSLAIDYLRRLIQRYPKSNLADDAQYRIAEIFLKLKHDRDQAYHEYSKVVSDFPSGDMRKKAERILAQLSKGESKRSVSRHQKQPIKPGPKLARVVGIRHWSNPDYTRVVIDVDRRVSFTKYLLNEDPDLNKPRRLYIDLKDAWIDPQSKAVPIHDGLLKQVRAAQHTLDTVRVVLDMKTIEDYEIFSLRDPFRIIVDVAGKTTAQIPAKTDVYKKTVARRPEYGIKKIVIDPGHGGKDPGAIGRNGLQEKDVVLEVAKKLEKRVKEILDCEVLLTRRRDVFLSLEERTAIANTKGADLFISIHTNAHKDRNIHGIETYYLDLTDDKDVLELAAKENGTSVEALSDLQVILRDLILQNNIAESSGLAECVQNCMVSELSKKYRGVNNLGVKQAPFVVLMGAQMPCILVEVSFISNKGEAKRLTSDGYLDHVASSIAKGVREYIRQMKAASIMGS
jgi:N-acetylmuramoyl-L-alanine amidase